MVNHVKYNHLCRWRYRWRFSAILKILRYRTPCSPGSLQANPLITYRGLKVTLTSRFTDDDIMYISILVTTGLWLFLSLSTDVWRVHFIRQSAFNYMYHMNTSLTHLSPFCFYTVYKIMRLLRLHCIWSVVSVCANSIFLEVFETFQWSLW